MSPKRPSRDGNHDESARFEPNRPPKVHLGRDITPRSKPEPVTRLRRFRIVNDRVDRAQLRARTAKQAKVSRAVELHARGYVPGGQRISDLGDAVSYRSFGQKQHADAVFERDLPKEWACCRKLYAEGELGKSARSHAGQERDPRSVCRFVAADGTIRNA
jgi:hypothetical protein